ncbi:MAG: four helix bundle protein [Anaerolineae bacterium]|nr:four helix bundle protein [Anaerolineae bacterium]
MEYLSFEEWLRNVSERVKREPIWDSLGYRKALFFYELVWQDCGEWRYDPRGKAIAEQLIRCAGSISANMEEGHGRGYGKERNWFYRIAIGSARESKGWYWRAHHLLAPQALEQRLALADEIIGILISELSRQQHINQRKSE